MWRLNVFRNCAQILSSDVVWRHFLQRVEELYNDLQCDGSSTSVAFLHGTRQKSKLFSLRPGVGSVRVLRLNVFGSPAFSPVCGGFPPVCGGIVHNVEAFPKCTQISSVEAQHQLLFSTGHSSRGEVLSRNVIFFLHIRNFSIFREQWLKGFEMFRFRQR